MNNAVTVIEPGTTKMTVLACRKGQNGSLELSGLGQIGYGGVQEDGWKSEKMLYHSLNAALGQARKMAGYKLNRCILGIPNEYCGLVRNPGKITPKNPITKQDVIEVRKLAATYSLPAPWEISNVIYGEMLMDGSPVENPIGLTCETLELEASVICINTDFAKQVTKVLRSLQIEVDKWIPLPLACGESLLTKEHKKNGVLWIDTGGESTDIAIYKDGIPIYYDWLPLGGNDISRDIATGIGVSFEEAERLKRSCVLGLAVNEDPETPEIQMPIRDGQHIHNVPMDFLQNIVEARIEEILELVYNQIREEGLESDYSNVVLAGGGLALFRGIRNFSAGILKQPVELGVPDVIGLSSPIFSSVYSLGYMGLNIKQESRGNIRRAIGELLAKLGIGFGNNTI